MIRLQRNWKHLQASRAQQQDASRPNTEDNVIDVDQDPNVVCSTLGTSFGCGLHRWKKCFTITNRFVAKLGTTLQQFDSEEKKNIIRSIVEHESFRALLLEYITFSKGSKKASQALGSMREAYAMLTFARQGYNSLFINILVIIKVSNVVNTSIRVNNTLPRPLMPLST